MTPTAASTWLLEAGHRSLGRRDHLRAESLLLRAANALEAEGCYAEAVQAWVGLGDSAHERGEERLVTRHLAHALRALEHVDDVNLLIRVLIKRGSAMGKLGDFEQGLASVGRAVELARKHRRRKRLVEALAATGRLCRDAGRLRRALATLEEACDLTRETDGRVGAIAAINLAEVYRMWRRFDEAMSLYERFYDSESTTIALAARLGAGQVSLSQGDYDQARGLFHFVRRHAISAELNGMRTEAEALLLPCHEAAGDVPSWTAAFEHCHRHLTQQRLYLRSCGWGLDLSGRIAESLGTREGRERAARAWSLALQVWRRGRAETYASATRRSLQALAPHRLPVPLHDLEVRHVIAEGGMAKIWLAQHRATGTWLALKVLDAERVGRPELRDAFDREVRVIAGLDHAHLARVLDHGTIPEAAALLSGGQLPEGSPYLVLDLAHGGNLEPACGRMTWRQARDVLEQLLGALAFAHASGLVHLDVKPANVLLQRPLRSAAVHVLLADFGLANAIGTSAHEGRIAGTPGFMAPEQLLGRSRDFGPWTDLYAVGCLAWAVCTGDPPFPPEVPTGPLRLTLPEFVPAMVVPNGTERWLKRLLAPSPAERFRSAADALAELRELEGIADETWTDALPVERKAMPPTWTMGSSILTLSCGQPVPAEMPAMSGTAFLPRSVVVPEDWRHAKAPSTGGVLTAGRRLFGLRRPPMVGRDDERNLLWGELRAMSRDRTPRVVVISGPAGLGKRRLGEWLLTRSAELGATLPLRAQKGEVDPILAAVLDRLGCSGLSGAALVARVVSAVRELGVGLPDIALAALEGGAPLDERQQGLLALLQILSLERPLALLVDEDSVGPEALEFTHRLLNADGLQLPVLLLLTVRDDQAGVAWQARLAELEEHPRASWLELEGLQGDAIEQLVGGLLKLDPSLTRMLAARAEGNPSFAVEVLRDLVARDLLAPGDEGHRLRPGVGVELPESLRSAWAERLAGALSGASQAELEGLQLAALLGGGVDVDMTTWTRTCQAFDVPTPRPQLEVLLAARLAQPADNGWRFAHVMARESLVQDARTSGRLRSMHRACLVGIRVARSEGRVDVLPHLLGSGELDKACGLLEQRVLEAVSRQAWPEAMGWIERLAGTLEAVAAPDDPRHARQIALRASVLLEQGALIDAARCAQEGRQRIGEHPELTRILGVVAFRQGRRRKAVQLLTHARDTFADLGDAAGAGRCGYAQGMVQRSVGDHAGAANALLWAQGLLKDDPVWLARCTYALGEVAVLREELGEGERHFQEALELYTQLRMRAGRGRALAGLADVARLQGKLDLAERRLGEGLALLESTRSSWRIAARLKLVLVLLARRSWAEALPHLRLAHQRLRAEEQLGSLVTVQALSALASAGLGQKVHFEAAIAEVERLMHATWIADPDTARALDEAAELAHKRGWRGSAQAEELARRQWVALGR